MAPAQPGTPPHAHHAERPGPRVPSRAARGHTRRPAGRSAGLSIGLVAGLVIGPGGCGAMFGFEQNNRIVLGRNVLLPAVTPTDEVRARIAAEHPDEPLFPASAPPAGRPSADDPAEPAPNASGADTEAPGQAAPRPTPSTKPPERSLADRSGWPVTRLVVPVDGTVHGPRWITRLEPGPKTGRRAGLYPEALSSLNLKDTPRGANRYSLYVVSLLAGFDAVTTPIRAVRDPMGRPQQSPGEVYKRSRQPQWYSATPGTAQGGLSGGGIPFGERPAGPSSASTESRDQPDRPAIDADTPGPTGASSTATDDEAGDGQEADRAAE